jgi:hypothetical protein
MSKKRDAYVGHPFFQCKVLAYIRIAFTENNFSRRFYSCVNNQVIMKFIYYLLVISDIFFPVTYRNGCAIIILISFLIRLRVMRQLREKQEIEG